MCGRLVDRVVGGLYPPVICNQGIPSDRGGGETPPGIYDDDPSMVPRWKGRK
jgi:hypothetical protein